MSMDQKWKSFSHSFYYRNQKISISYLFAITWKKWNQITLMIGSQQKKNINMDTKMQQKKRKEKYRQRNVRIFIHRWNNERMNKMNKINEWMNEIDVRHWEEMKQIRPEKNYKMNEMNKWHPSSSSSSE